MRLKIEYRKKKSEKNRKREILICGCKRKGLTFCIREITCGEEMVSKRLITIIINMESKSLKI